MKRGVGEGLTEFKKGVDELIGKGEEKSCGMMDMVGEDLKRWKGMGLEGNGY